MAYSKWTKSADPETNRGYISDCERKNNIDIFELIPYLEYNTRIHILKYAVPNDPEH
jgi:hypothetical protein